MFFPPLFLLMDPGWRKKTRPWDKHPGSVTLTYYIYIFPGSTFTARMSHSREAVYLY
jgi:hypothetical protein